MSSNPTAVRVDSLTSLLSAIPHVLGYHPTDSVIGIAIHEGGKLGMVQRIDIPPSDQIPALLGGCVPPMLRQEPASVLVLGYESITGQAVTAVRALSEALSGEGIDVAASVVVSPTGWRHLSCTCCPADGNPLPVPEHPTGVEMRVTSGTAPAESRAAFAHRLAPNERADTVGAACRKVRPAQAEDPQAVALAWGRLIASETPVEGVPDGVLALATVGLTRKLMVEFRDALLCHLIPSSFPDDLLDQSMMEAIRAGVPLDPATPKAHTPNRLIQVAASLPDHYAPPTLTVTGTYAWWAGDGTLSRIALDRALHIDPNYRLAGLISRMVDLGVRLP